MSKHLLLFTLFSLALSICASNAWAASYIKPPFNLRDIRHEQGERNEKDFTCPAPPKPVQNLDYESFYTDPHASIIDQAKRDEYLDSYKPMAEYETNMAKWANTYLKSRPVRIDYAACALDWMDEWAKADALSGQMSKNGEHIRKWFLASVASSYVQIKNAKSLDAEKEKRVETWITHLGNAVIKDYSADPERPSHQNNHLNWAAWAVGIASVAVQNHEFYDWSIKKTEFVINQIDIDGTLPHEIYRKSRALQYHIFAAIPLITMAELAGANGRDLYKDNNGALHRLVLRIVKSINDPDYMARKAGARQKISDEPNLSWLEVYAKHFPKRITPQMEDLLDTAADQQIFTSRIGGDVDLLYTP